MNKSFDEFGLCTNLSDKPFLNDRIFIGAQCLLQKRKQDGDDNRRFKSLSKDNKEHWPRYQLRLSLMTKRKYQAARRRSPYLP